VHVTRKLVLAGHFGGRTIRLRHWQFVNGECTLEGDEISIEQVTEYLSRCYQAFPEGHPRIAEVNELYAIAKREGKTDGKLHIQTAPELRPTESVPVELRPAGTEPAAKDTADGRGDDDALPRTKGLPPAGDGQDGAEVREPEARISEALAKLDPANDEHWTSNDLPRVDIVAQLSDVVDVNRARIEALAPEFRRVRPEE
jgi:hypothetical protein